MAKLRVGVLISGRGSNMRALIEACADSAYPAEIVVVISNVPEAPGLAHAAAAGIATVVIDHKAYVERSAFDDALHAALLSRNVDLVCLAGFMRLLTEAFVGRWHDRLVNIHPSLLPAFRGLRVHERVIAYGARFSGCTVHFVRSAMDDGPIIVQAVVAVHADDDPERLAARVLTAEHRSYPLAVRLIAEGRARVVGERVMITGARAPSLGVLNPEAA
jgi:phosphoribosylglycinamide formyltransferase-1